MLEHKGARRKAARRKAAWRRPLPPSWGFAKDQQGRIPD